MSIHHFHSVQQSENASKHTIIKQFWVWMTYGPSESFSNSGIVCWIWQSLVVCCAECIGTFLNAVPANGDYLLQHLCLKYLSSQFWPRHNQSFKRHAVSVYTFLFLMCLFPLEEAGWWKITAFPFGAEQNMSQWHKGNNTKEAMKHGFILVQGGSMSGRAFHYDIYFKFYSYRKRLHANKTWHIETHNV